MIVTVMSDASFCQQTNCAGWGVWIKSQRGHFEGGGNFKTDCHHPAHAEAMAASIAVWVAFKQGIAQPGDEILIQTDCLLVVHHYERKVGVTRRMDGIEKTIQFTKKLIEDNRCTLRIRHVKGHAPKLGGRNYVNEICDRAAKKAMKAQRMQKFPEAYPNGNSVAQNERQKRRQERKNGNQ